LKENNRIALIGFRASGKSLVGKLLARQLDLSFVDMDEALMTSSGRRIDQWVRAEGWEPFRQAESELLEKLARESGLVVATGGGVVLNSRNRNLLKNHFLVIWLKASPETTYLRMRDDPATETSRPAFTSLPLREEIQETLAQRSDLYEETAHLIFETDALTVLGLVSEILSQLSRL
jgi:shikimate kinase